MSTGQIENGIQLNYKNKEKNEKKIRTGENKTRTEQNGT